MQKNESYRLEIMARLLKATKYFTKKEYARVVERANNLFSMGHINLSEKELDKLPSTAQLLESLLKKLKEKRLHKTLKKLQEGKIENDLFTAKGLSSLLTHVLIEVDKGNNEYKVLVSNILEKLSEISYNILQ